MASSALFRLASCQLRLVSLRTTSHGVTQRMEPSRRCCHDDSKPRKRNNKKVKPQTTSSRTITKAVGPAVNLLEKDLQLMAQERQRSQEKLQGRSTLQRRMDLLLSLGCTMDQIQNKVKVLDLSEQVILQRATMLKKLGRSAVTVNLLLSSCYSSQDLLRRHVERREELDSATCTALHCSPEQLDRLKAHHPSLNRFRCLTGPDILEKSRVLHGYGITAHQIRAFPAVLNVKVENIKVRLDTLKALREEGKVLFERYPLKTVALRTRDFEKCVENAILGRAEVDGARITHATIAQRLGVRARDIEDASVNFYKLGPSSVLKKIDYLLREGISSPEIVSHIYVMKYRLEMLKWAVEKSKSVVVSPPPPIYIVLSFLRSGRLPKKSFVWSRQRTFVASLFAVGSKDLPSCVYLRPLWSSDRLCIKRNFDFLASQGFSGEDIFSCLIVLAHDPDHLQAYYHGLWRRPELSAHAQTEVDRKQTLSLLQYVIEKDMNFSSVVFNAEVEFDPGVPGKEEDGESSPLHRELEAAVDEE